MLDLDEATRRAFALFSELPTERVGHAGAQDRFLSADLSAREDVPAFDNSAMDGYAVRAAEVASADEGAPVELRVSGESRAGVPAPIALEAGCAIRIFTGAKVPDGADAIVIQENTDREGDRVHVRKASREGQHIRRRGEVFEAGARVLDADTELRAGELAIAASQGYALLPVCRRPRVAILSTGDELRPIGAPIRAGSLVDSNSYGLAAAVREAGGIPVVRPLGVDDRDALMASVRECLREDVVVSTGGISVGDYDLVQDVFRACEVEQSFWKARIKPGKPVWVGRSPGGAPVIGLPGNPVSALVTFEVFLRPGLRRMLGDPRPHRELVEVELARPMRAPESRTELIRARVEDGVAHPHGHQGSGATTSMVAFDALVILPAGAGELTHAKALDVRGGRGSARSPWEA